MPSHTLSEKIKIGKKKSKVGPSERMAQLNALKRKMKR